jgi:hypothetical protein
MALRLTTSTSAAARLPRLTSSPVVELGLRSVTLPWKITTGGSIEVLAIGRLGGGGGGGGGGGLFTNSGLTNASPEPATPPQLANTTNVPKLPQLPGMGMLNEPGKDMLDAGADL